jgi:hypothetical protein
MGALHDVKDLVLRYPLTFLAFGAAAAAALPVVAVSTSSALRPWARRIVASALAIRGEASRVAAESREAYADLVAEAVRGTDAVPAPRPAPHAEAVAIARSHRFEPSQAERSAAPVA